MVKRNKSRRADERRADQVIECPVCHTSDNKKSESVAHLGLDEFIVKHKLSEDIIFCHNCHSVFNKKTNLVLRYLGYHIILPLRGFE